MSWPVTVSVSADSFTAPVKGDRSVTNRKRSAGGKQWLPPALFSFFSRFWIWLHSFYFYLSRFGRLRLRQVEKENAILEFGMNR